MKRMLCGIFLVSLAWFNLTPAGSAAADTQPDSYASARKLMVEQQLAGPGRDIKNRRVLSAMGKIPRHELMPAEVRSSAYADRPVPIGHGQTISQPYIVAFMTEKLD